MLYVFRRPVVCLFDGRHANVGVAVEHASQPCRAGSLGADANKIALRINHLAVPTCGTYDLFLFVSACKPLVNAQSKKSRKARNDEQTKVFCGCRRAARRYDLDRALSKKIARYQVFTDQGNLLFRYKARQCAQKGHVSAF